MFTEEFLKLAAKAEGPDELLQIDVIILILLLSISPNYKKKIDALIIEKVGEKILTHDLWISTVDEHKDGLLKDYFPIILSIGETLLRASRQQNDLLAVTSSAILASSFKNGDTWQKQV